MLRTSLHPILAALLRAPLAWQTPQEIATALDQSLDDISDQLCDLDVAGVLDVSDLDIGIVVAFSFTTINELELELIDDERTGLPRWSLRQNTRGGGAQQVTSDQLDAMEDPYTGDPYVVVALAELEALRAERRRRKRERRGLPLRYQDVPTPSIVYTGPAGLPWHEPEIDGRDNRCARCLVGKRRRKVLSLRCPCGRGDRARPRPERCQACPCRPLSRSEYCLDCGRWGWDDYFHPKPSTHDGQTEEKTA